MKKNKNNKIIVGHPEKVISVFVKMKRNFTVVRGMNMTKVKIGNEVKRIRTPDNPFQKGLYLFKLVKRDAEEYLQKNTISTLYDINRFPISLIQKDKIVANSNNEIVGTDIRLCYWTTAYNVGIIRQKTYEDAIKKGDEFKPIMVAAIGALANKKIEEIYEGGVKKGEREITNPKLQLVNELIVQTVAKIFFEMSEYLGPDFIMYKTDCIYYIKERKHEVHEILTRHKYTYRDIPSILRYEGPRLIIEEKTI